MALIKISDLTLVSAVAGTNQLEVNESGTSKKATATQFLTFIKANTTPADIGAQPVDTTLTALAGLATGVNKIPIATGTDTFSQLDFKDEDDMVSDATTAVPSQQSVKAYVDNTTNNLIVNATTATPDTAADYFIFEDATDSTQKKALLSTLATLTSETAQATTSGTAKDFTGIPSSIKRITVTLKAVSTSGTSAVIVQIGDSEGLETTGYTSIATNQTSNSSPTNGFAFFGTTASDSRNGSMVLINISGNEWVVHGVNNTATGINSAVGMLAGNKTLTGTLDRLRLTTVGGTDTFDAGSVNILYE